jgi:hypothetical protein
VDVGDSGKGLISHGLRQPKRQECDRADHNCHAPKEPKASGVWTCAINGGLHFLDRVTHGDLIFSKLQRLAGVTIRMIKRRESAGIGALDRGQRPMGEGAILHIGDGERGISKRDDHIPPLLCRGRPPDPHCLKPLKFAQYRHGPEMPAPVVVRCI